MRKRTLALIGLTALTLSGCSGDNGDAEAASVECEPVEAGLLQAITEGANQTTITAIDGAALPVPDAGSYVVAMTFTVDGVPEEQMGVWETTSLTLGEASVRGVDGLAHEFTVWPESALTVTDDVVDDVLTCLE